MRSQDTMTAEVRAPSSAISSCTASVRVLGVGAREVAERTLMMKTRLGRPAAIAGSPEAASAPGFAVCAGLIQYYANLGAERETGLGLLRQSPQAGKRSSVFGGVESWLRAKF